MRRGKLTNDGSSDTEILHDDFVGVDGSDSDGILDGVCEKGKWEDRR